MRFITGPRQCGKTTLAKDKLEAEGCSALYYLWDRREVRLRHKANELFFTDDSPPGPTPQWVCFDEIHKMPRWKNILKAAYDSTQDHYRFIVTGSAKFDMYRRSGDSLAGRYFTFQLYPLSLAELGTLEGPDRPPPAGKTRRNGSGGGEPPMASAGEFLQGRLDAVPLSPQALDQLLEFGGFPEPFLRHSARFLARWSEDYLDRVVREDIGALTRIIDHERLYDLYRLLPEMVGNPLSAHSLSGHLEVSPPTIRDHLRRLEDFYLTFHIRPYAKNIKRALLKAPKVYLFDWTRIADPGARFENYVAVELLSLTRAWEELTGVHFRLRYVRTKERHETDFLLTQNGDPWLLIECKLSDGPVAGHHHEIQKQLKGIPFVQVCRQEGVAGLSGKDIFRMSASRFFSGG